MHASDAESCFPEPTLLWYASLDQAVPWAQAWNCPLVVFFAARWCEWSQRLLAETLADPGVRGLLQQMVCVWIEGDESLQLLQDWDINMYPTALVLGPNGVEMGRIRGFEDPTAWGDRLRRILIRASRSRGSCEHFGDSEFGD